MAEVMFEKLSPIQQDWLLFLKVYGYSNCTCIKENVKNGLMNRGLIQFKTDKWGPIELTELGKKITPPPSAEWCCSQEIDLNNELEYSLRQIEFYQRNVERTNRKLELLKQAQEGGITS